MWLGKWLRKCEWEMKMEKLIFELCRNGIATPLLKILTILKSF